MFCRWLDIKFLLEVVILPLLVVSAAAAAGDRAWKDMKNNVYMHSFMPLAVIRTTTLSDPALIIIIIIVIITFITIIIIAAIISTMSTAPTV